jgi:hypothetical protein
MTPHHVHRIALSLRDVDQLFNTMDPSPFHDKDLDRDAEEFITSWAREYPADEPIALSVHLEQWPAEDPTTLIRTAVHNYFEQRAKLAGLEFRRLMRQGRTSLIIGLGFLAACLVAAELLIADGATGLSRYVRESFTIAGWVAMWRPMEIYLYDWWPVRRRQRDFVRLSTMPVEVLHTTPQAGD